MNMNLCKIFENYFNPNQPGLFGTSQTRGGGGIKTKRFLIYNIAIFPSKSTKHGPKWKLTSLPICRVFDHFSMLNSLVVRGRRSSLVWSLAFGTTIFEILKFFTNIGNMYIKWKLKTFQIRIWHKKYNLLWKNCKKLIFHDFCVQFRWDFFFRNANFSENFIYTPPIFFHPCVLQMTKKNYMKVRHP